MKIWVDLATAPQVLFMQPIIAELRKRGFEVLITTRDFTETIGLANHYGLDHIPVGAHGGMTIIGKIFATFQRAAHLAHFIQSQHITLAIGSSYGEAITATWLHLPMVAMADYEGQPAHHILCRVAKRIIVPEAFNKNNLRRYGATEKKIVSYPGIKEQLYLAAFTPNPAFRKRLDIPAENVLAILRPPSLVSAYHRFKNSVFDETIQYVTSYVKTVVVLLPRGTEQRKYYMNLGLPNVMIPSEIVDGPQLVYSADLVIGAGGTMNREATVLGTPVYTQFQGESSSVDDYLIKQGKMMRVIKSVDIPSIRVCKKLSVEGEPWRLGVGLVEEVVDKILS